MNYQAALESLNKQLDDAVQKVYKLQGAIETIQQLMQAEQAPAEETPTEETTEG